jgi:hypothetical protein
LVNFIQGVRALDLKKAPAVSETIDWAKSLVLLHADTLEKEIVEKTLNVILKFEDDIETANRELRTLLSGIDSQ